MHSFNTKIYRMDSNYDVSLTHIRGFSNVPFIANCLSECHFAFFAVNDVNGQVSFLSLKISSVPSFHFCFVEFHASDTRFQNQNNLLGQIIV